jgi:hypothetical protein
MKSRETPDFAHLPSAPKNDVDSPKTKHNTTRAVLNNPKDVVLERQDIQASVLEYRCSQPAPCSCYDVKHSCTTEKPP